jgi:hypothetical protein
MIKQRIEYELGDKPSKENEYLKEQLGKCERAE